MAMDKTTTNDPPVLCQKNTTVSAKDASVAIGGDVKNSKISITVIHQGNQIVLPSAEVVRNGLLKFRAKLEEEARDKWGGMGAYICEEGARLPVEASPYSMGVTGERKDLMQCLDEGGRTILLGEPGSGKTVALHRLAWELCGRSELVMPVRVRLGQYAEASISERIRASLSGAIGFALKDKPALDAFLDQEAMRCFFLFDGLNETHPNRRDKLIEELVLWLTSHNRHGVVVTSRIQDESWRRLRDEVDRTIVIQPITDTQIRKYLEEQLAERSQKLFERMDGRLRTLAQRPLFLWMIAKAVGDAEELPHNRAELYDRFVSRRLKDDAERKIADDAPDSEKRKIAAVLAWRMHERKVLDRVLEKKTDLVWTIRDGGDEPWSESSGKAIQCLVRQGFLIGDDIIRFWHQTFQEHFAARFLDATLCDKDRSCLSLPQTRIPSASAGKNRWSWWRRHFAYRRLKRLVKDDWWTETLVQLAGMVDDPSTLVLRISRWNPWLAWWCAAEREDVSKETLEKVEKASIRRLRSRNVRERRRAVATLTRTGCAERAIEHFFDAAGDEDTEIAEIAVGWLISNWELVRPLVEKAVHKKDAVRHRAALRCWSVTSQRDERVNRVLEEIMGFQMLWIPAGSFLMGSDKTKDPQASNDEVPQRTVVLPGYWIGKCPVTVSQFESFVKETGHRMTSEEWRKKSQGADHPVTWVNVDDAMAYCSWLTKKTGLRFTLPSEEEWEKAARGTDGRIYPWGNEFDPKKMNCHESGIGDTTPVGSFPDDKSPYGCLDMAGNVCEWTRSRWGKILGRVVRGGTFGFGGSARCAFRDYIPRDRLGIIGFRVMASLFSSPMNSGRMTREEGDEQEGAAD